MKLFRISFSLFLIPLLIFSSGGFNIFTHLCHETGKKIISVQGPQDCEHDHGVEHSEEHSCGSCCENTLNSGNCCENIHEFIRTVETISFDEDEVAAVEDPVEKSIVAVSHIELREIAPNNFNKFDFSSPPRRTSKYLVVKYNNLKLDCCNS